MRRSGTAGASAYRNSSTSSTVMSRATLTLTFAPARLMLPIHDDVGANCIERAYICGMQRHGKRAAQWPPSWRDARAHGCANGYGGASDRNGPQGNSRFARSRLA